MEAAGNIVMRHNKEATELAPNYQPNKPEGRSRDPKAITQENLPFESLAEYLLLIHIAGR